MARYLRIASLGDSTTFGIGDPVPTHVSPSGWRGWARLLSGALSSAYDVSACNLAVSGATSRCVVEGQLADAVAHRPDVASLVVGVNDTMRSTWDVARIRHDLMSAAEALHGTGALLLTARFHDHGRVFGLPGVLRRPLAARIEAVNRVYDEVHATYGGLRVDLATCPEVLVRRPAAPLGAGAPALRPALRGPAGGRGPGLRARRGGARGRGDDVLALRRALDGRRGGSLGGSSGTGPRAVGGTAGVDRGARRARRGA